MTRLFLAAGVAALAIAAPATAKPGGGHGGGQGGQPQAQAPHGGGNGGGGQARQRGGGGGGGPRMQMQRQGGGGGGGPRFQAQSFERHGGGGGQQQRFAMQRQERQQVHAQRQQQSRGFERQQRQAQNRNVERQQMRVQRQAQNRNVERQQMRQQRQAQNRNVERQQQFRQQQAQNRGFQRQQMKANRNLQAQNRGFDRQQMRQLQAQNGNFDRMRGNQFRMAQNRQVERQRLNQQSIQQLRQQRFTDRRLNGQFVRDARFNNDARQFVQNQQRDYWQAVNGTRFAALNYGARNTILAPTVVERFVGVPVATVGSFAALSPLPASIQYLYPNTSNYYYQYGDGYLYQVNRGSGLIAALMPLLAGGYLPGQYLPPTYMNSYVPASYGYNAFYPDYGDTCNRYGYGVVYEVDCYTGFVEDVIPVYSGGYGVGQILPSSYAYYNVPQQYRRVYYDTPDYNYWYAPGAIYQYDRGSSMITSVAALLSPGFAVGQPLPMGYDVYNVPYAYRPTYYDTQTAWYRYNNGYIYQVDPTTRLVTAIVASLLT